MNKITIFTSCGDAPWEILFVNEKLIEQNPSFNINDIAEFCPIESIEDYQLTEKWEKYLYNHGELPSDVKFEEMF